MPSTHDGFSSDESDYILASTATPPAASSPWSPVSDRAVPSTSSPLRSALSTWGLTVNDLDFASLHGTSTKANDLNEAQALHTQLTHLGRTPGHPLWSICQKSITGHPKAPAAAWMLNGCLQVLDTGLIPGNRNADSVDPALRKFHHLCYPTQTVQFAAPGPKAFLLTSFGFGQKSGQVVGVAPRFLFAALPRGGFEEYREKAKARQMKADRAFAKAVMEGNLVKIKAKPQFAEKDAARVYLDPGARVVRDGRMGEYRFEQSTA